MRPMADVPLERHFLDREGTELSYLRCGTGKTVVFLHGLAGESGEFAPTMEALAGAFHCIALDQRGHGRSTSRPAELTRESFVEDVVALIERVSPEGTVHLVGQSMGAHTAMLVAARRPELIDSLVLLEGDAGAGASEGIVAMERFFASWPVPFATRADAQAFLGDSALAAAWVKALERQDDGFRPRFDPDIMSTCMGFVAQGYDTEWAAVEAPTIVMYAEHGMFTEEQKQAFIARRPVTQRVDLAGAGHDAHLDSFGVWMQHLGDFLQEHENAV